MMFTRIALAAASLAAGTALVRPQDAPPREANEPKVTRDNPHTVTWNFTRYYTQDAPQSKQPALKLYNQALRYTPLDVQDANNLLFAYAGVEDDAMGVSFSTLEPALRAQLRITDDRGLLVASVAAGSPADQVGLKPNDIVCALESEPILKSDDIVKQLKSLGEKVGTLQILRNGKIAELKVKAVTRVTLAPAAPANPQYYLGVQTTTPDETLRSHLELPEGQGLVICEVIADSPAKAADLRVGDIVLTFADDQPLTDTESLVSRIQSTQGEPSKLKVLRGGKPITIEVTPVPRPEQDAASRSYGPHGLGMEQLGEPSTYRYMLANPHWRGANRLTSVPNDINTPIWTRLLEQTATMPGTAAPTPPGTAQEDQQATLKSLRAEVEDLRSAVDALRKSLEEAKK